MLGIGVDAVTTTPGISYRIDPAQVRPRSASRTKAMVIPSPGNPTGVVLSEQELEALADICQQHGSSSPTRSTANSSRRAWLQTPIILGCENTEDIAIVIDSVSSGTPPARRVAVSSPDQTCWRLFTTDKPIVTVDQHADSPRQTPQSSTMSSENTGRRNVLVGTGRHRHRSRTAKGLHCAHQSTMLAFASGWCRSSPRTTTPSASLLWRVLPFPPR